jgi:hypothetical protein
VFGPRLVWTKESDTTALFVPLSGATVTDRINQLRATIDRDSSSGDCRLQAAYQETDTPDDPDSWGAAVAFGSTADNNGILYPTAWSSVSFTKRHARFGALASNISTSGQIIEAIRATMRVDARES